MRSHRKVRFRHVSIPRHHICRNPLFGAATGDDGGGHARCIPRCAYQCTCGRTPDFRDSSKSGALEREGAVEGGLCFSYGWSLVFTVLQPLGKEPLCLRKRIYSYERSHHRHGVLFYRNIHRLRCRSRHQGRTDDAKGP